MSPSHASTPTVAATFGRPTAQCLRSRRLAVFLLVVIGLIGLAAEQAQADAIWGPVTPAVFADGMQHATPSSTFADVSCASAGNCTAVGSFSNADGHTEAFAQLQTGGVWGVAGPVLAGSVDQTSSDVSRVSCASAGNCTAVGVLRRANSTYEMFAVTLTGGSWQPADFISFPAGSSAPQVKALSCASAGNCTAVGSFSNAGGREAFAVTQADGVWGQATPTTFSGTDSRYLQHGDELTSLSCTSPGYCTAVGKFKVAYARFKAFAQVQTAGVWGVAVPFDFSAVPDPVSGSFFGSEARAVSCGSPGNCTAVGTYWNDLGMSVPFIVTQTGGNWEPAAVPADAPLRGFRSVSCSGAGDCTAVGDGFAVTQTGGMWGTAALTAMPAGSPYLEMSAVSCASAGNCAAVGSYDLGVGPTPFTWMQTGGTWSTGSPSDFGSLTRATYFDDYLYSVSCAGAGAGECTAVGFYMNADDNVVAFSQTQSSGGTPPPVNAGGADAPTITGEAIVGETLAAGHGTWSNPPASEAGYGYLWQVSESGTDGWAAITGADPNLASFVVPAAYEGRYLRVQVIAYGAATSEPAYSAVSARVTRREAASTPSETPRTAPLLASSSEVLQPFSPAPGITVGATRGAVTLAASARAACRDLVRGANIWVRSTSRVMCVQRSLPAALSLRNGLVQAATPGAYPITVRINRANGTQVTRTITITVR